MGHPNPFYIAGEVTLHQGEHPRPPGWYYHDETGDWTGPFKSQRRALRELLGYVRWLEDGPTRVQRVWWPVKWWARGLWKQIVAFARDERSGHDTRRARQGEGEEGPGGPSPVL